MTDVEDRLGWVDRVMAAPPIVHPTAPNGAVWRTEASCYRFMAREVSDAARTLETGAGLSTVLFAAWGCDHLTVVPFEREVEAITDHCAGIGVDLASVRFDVRPSEVALPELTHAGELDLVFIDGAHGYPTPIIDWFYGAGRLRRGGLAVFDDVQLPQVAVLVHGYLRHDPDWQRVAGTDKWIAFRRLSEGLLSSSNEKRQEFFPALPLPLDRRMAAAMPPALKRLVPPNVRMRLRQVLGN